MKKRILITGGAGFIGSHLVDVFASQNYTVAVLDNFSSGTKANLPATVKIYEADIRNAKAVSEIITQYKPNSISHHAAHISVPRSVTNPQFDAETNILGTLNLLESARLSMVQHFIFASSGGAIYGNCDHPATENDPVELLSPYAASKLSAETYLNLYHRLYGLKISILRYSNVYGPRQNTSAESGVIATFCQKALQNDTLTIFGNGTATRDYVNVADVARANLLVAENEAEGVFNIGTSIPTSTKELVEIISSLASKNLTLAFAASRSGEVAHSILDAKKAWIKLSWKANIKLKEGVADTLHWYENH